MILSWDGSWRVIRLGFSSSSTNQYRYVNNDPVNRLDPNSLDECNMSQSSGTVICIDDFGNISGWGKGYSGSGPGRNNPDKEGETNVGPTPKGRYIIGPPYSSPNTGSNTRSLTPDAATRSKFPANRNADSFKWHGNNSTNDASQGCPISDPILRLTPRTGSPFTVGPW